MLEKPKIPEKALLSCIQTAYGLPVSSLSFLPIGADPDTAVYRVVSREQISYFLKLRSGPPNDLAADIPAFLHTRGIKNISAPIATSSGARWTTFTAYRVTLYPFLRGQNGFTVQLSPKQWEALGQTLCALHQNVLPKALADSLSRETYTSYWRDQVRSFQQRIVRVSFDECSSSRKLAQFLRNKEPIITNLVERADYLAQVLVGRSLPLVLCHADIHAGNVLVDGSDTIHVVDWDTLILAPKERDLMFIGGGVGGVWNDEKETELFYQGYGSGQIDPTALAYYRYERIIEDIAVTCQQLLTNTDGGADREEYYKMLVTQFEPSNVVEIANQSANIQDFFLN